MATVGGQPRDELLAGQPLGLAATLGGDQVLGTADLGRQGPDLIGGERLLDEIAERE